MSSLTAEKQLWSNYSKADNGGWYIHARVNSAPTALPKGFLYTVKIDSVYNHRGVSIAYRIQGKLATSLQINIGEYIIARGDFRPANNFTTRESGSTQFLYRENFFNAWTIRVVNTKMPFLKPVQKHILKTIRLIDREDSRAVMSAATIGQKQHLTKSLKRTFKNAGIYHLLALSGLHIGIIGAVVFFICSFLNFSKRLKILTTIISLWAFLLMVGITPSLFRAVTMATVILMSFVCQKINYPLNAIGVAGCIWLMLDSNALNDIGFQLSFAATFCILSLYKPIRSLITWEMGNLFSSKIYTAIISSSVISLCAFIGTAPILLINFGTISLFGIFYNIIAVAIMTIAMWSFMLAVLAACISIQAATFILYITDLSVRLLTYCAMPANNVSLFNPVFENIPLRCLAPYIMFFFGLSIINSSVIYNYLKMSFSVLFLITPAIILTVR